MPDIHGQARFNLVTDVVGCSYTGSLGISPSAAELVITPTEPFIGDVGNLILTDNRVTLNLRGCKVDAASFRYDRSGRIVRLALFDRRWRWAHPTISGFWNQRDDKGNLILETTKTPRQLAAACLLEMGETGGDLSALPDDSRPTVDWEYTPAAEALQQLVEELGCAVAYRPDSDSVRIVKLGVGMEAPKREIMDDNIGVSLPVRPDELIVAGGRTRFQVRLALEAVGLDTDGQVKPIEELSYTPENGWHTTFPPHFGNVGGDNANRLARETVFRWYRVKLEDVSGHGNIKIPGKKERLLKLSQILPLDDTVIQDTTAADAIAGVDVFLPKETRDAILKADLRAKLTGEWYDGRKGNPVNTEAGTVYRKSFTVEKDRGIVQLQEAAFRIISGRSHAAIFQLLTTVNLRHPTTGAWDCYLRNYVFGGKKYGTKARVIRKEDIVLEVVPTYDAGGNITKVTTNEKDIRPEAEYYLLAAAAEYAAKATRDIGYAGLQRVFPDGLNRQVTWQVGNGQPATTRVSQNAEHSNRVPDYRERRQAERQRVELWKQVREKVKDRNIKQAAKRGA